MTDLPDPTADGAATELTPEGDAPAAGDAELAALVRSAPSSAADGDPALAALVRPAQPAPAPAATPDAAAPEPALVPDAPTDAPAPDLAAAAVAAPPADPLAATQPLPVGAPVPAAPEPVAAVPAGTPAADAPTAATTTPVASRRRSLAMRFAFSFLLGVVLVVVAGAGAIYAWGQQYNSRILPGVHVGATDLSGLTRGQAQATLASAYAPLGVGRIVLTGPEGQTTIAYKDIARGPDTTALLDAALAAGRQGEPLADLIGAPQAAIHGITLDSAVTYDRAKLVAAVDAIAAAVDQLPVDAAVVTGSGGTLSVTPAKDGREVDKAALLVALDAQLTKLDTPSEIALQIPMATVAPTVSTDAATAAKAAADRMAADLVLTRGTDSWTIPSSAIRPLISFQASAADGSITPVFDPSGLDPLLASLAKQVNQTVVDAGLKLVGKHVVATGASREGRTLDVAGTKAAIVAQIAARQAGTAIEPLAAVVDAVDPKLSQAQAGALAAQMVPISSFSVYYWVIVNNNWGGNIEGPANKINGTVVPAGGTFDFWKVVGDLHNIPGVGPGNAIEGGKITVTGAFGGGICTTSTTLFNAAFRAGMVPLARANHNEYITRYPPGLDATVWIVGNTKQTMSFLNDTQYPILIQTVVTKSGSIRWLTFKIWSVPNGRTYKISDLVIQNGPRAIDTVVKDSTKPVGYTYRNNAPADGAKVWVTVTIYDHGQVHWSKRYYSNYPAVNGVLVVGTKGASAPAPAPSPSPGH